MTPVMALTAATVKNANRQPSKPNGLKAPMFVAYRAPSMPPELMVSHRAPNARPRDSLALRSAVKDCTLGMTRAKPTPLTAARGKACDSSEVQAA